RVRARVRPAGPRPKRSRRSGGREDRPRNAEGRDTNKSKGPRSKPAEGDRPRGSREKPEGARTKQNSNGPLPRPEKVSLKESSMAGGITLAEQGAIGKSFLEGLLSSMKIIAEVSVR